MCNRVCLRSGAIIKNPAAAAQSPSSPSLVYSHNGAVMVHWNYLKSWLTQLLQTGLQPSDREWWTNFLYPLETRMKMIATTEARTPAAEKQIFTIFNASSSSSLHSRQKFPLRSLERSNWLFSTKPAFCFLHLVELCRSTIECPLWPSGEIPLPLASKSTHAVTC